MRAGQNTTRTRTSREHSCIRGVGKYTNRSLRPVRAGFVRSTRPHGGGDRTVVKTKGTRGGTRRAVDYAGARLADRRRYDRIIQKYLSDCYAKRTVARASELAELLDANRPYLAKVIFALFGKPLRKLLRERQFEEAKRLLRLTPLCLDEVAVASAFGHRSTFYRLFLQAFGMTPTEYRRKATNCDFTGT